MLDMPVERPHRKLVRHYDEPGQAHELTFSCYQRLPLLTDHRRCAVLSAQIDRAVGKQGFELVAFVYMPEHVHLIVFPVESDATVSSLLFAIKRPSSYRFKRMMLERNDHWVDRLTIRERPGRTTFRFWQEGGGYDRNITNVSTLKTAIDYVHHNPVRRGLCDSPEDWHWSSWSYYWAPEKPRSLDLPAVHGFVE